VFPVVGFHDVFGFGMLHGAEDFAETAAHANFFFSNDSFHHPRLMLFV
jgi:hypothetical protein